MSIIERIRVGLSNREVERAWMQRVEKSADASTLKMRRSHDRSEQPASRCKAWTRTRAYYREWSACICFVSASKKVLC